MFTTGDFHTTFIRLMHRAGRGEDVISDLDELIARLERSLQAAPDRRQSVVDIRGSLMTHFVGPRSASAVRKDPEARKVYFAAEAIDRLAGLMAQAA